MLQNGFTTLLRIVFTNVTSIVNKKFFFSTFFADFFYEVRAMR
jgi:hypothetical protein